jgi:hypothetical protein
VKKGEKVRQRKVKKNNSGALKEKEREVLGFMFDFNFRKKKIILKFNFGSEIGCKFNF